MAYGESTDSDPGSDVSMGRAVEALREAYRHIDMPARRYLLVVLLPAAAFFVLVLATVFLVSLPLLVSVPLALLGLLIFFSAVTYPKLVLEQRRQQLNERIHLMITHLTVLSTTNIDRMEVFRKLAQEDEYRALSEEIHRVVQIVDGWNQSLDDALRRRAKEVPSKALSDFFDRLAYTLGAGQELSDFLLSEQSVVIQNYVTAYEGALGNMEVMKDLYLSMILSMTFGLVFAVVLPVLTGTNPTLTVSAVIVLFAFVQTGFYYAIKTIIPHDPVWYFPDDIEPRGEAALRRAIALGVVLAMVFAAWVVVDYLGLSPVPLASLLPMADVPLPLYAVIPLTPLVIPGVVIRRMEREIKDRDEEFPSFIRSLGATESAKQSTTSDVLSDLRGKDFGSLTDEVNNLFKRLNMRIEPRQAWEYFAADSQSYLIQKFSEMYLVGRHMGGNPKQLGELISQNMNEVIQLRQRRKQATITLIGVLYGITAASTFAFFIGLEVVALLAEMSFDLSTTGLQLGGILSTSNYDLPLVEFLLITVVLFNAMLSSLMIRTVDGGHKMNAYIHFVALSWLGALVGVFTRQIVGALIAI